MTVVRRERSACLRSSVTFVIESHCSTTTLATHSLGAGHSTRCLSTRTVLPPAVCEARGYYPCLFMALLAFPVHDRQGPAPAGQLPGYPDRGDGGAFLAGVECPPPLVQPAVGLIGPRPHDRRLTVSATDHVRRQSIRF